MKLEASAQFRSRAIGEVMGEVDEEEWEVGIMFVSWLLAELVKRKERPWWLPCLSGPVTLVPLAVSVALAVSRRS
jgi:hypothetical protein